MRKVVWILLAVFGAVVMFLLLLTGLTLAAVASRKHLPRQIVLELDFEEGLEEYVPEVPWARLFGPRPLTVRDLVDALARAAEDKRVLGLVARVGTSPMGLAQVQEARDAIASFRARGKFALAYAETFGEVGPGNAAYYLAAAFDEIYLQPSGDVGLTGLIYETPFLRGTLDKLGIVPRMDHRHEYKNAMNVFTERKYTPAHREATAALMDAHFRQIVRGIAEGRGLEEKAVARLIDRGPFLGQEAVEAGLVDGLRYRDEVYALAKERAGARARFLFLRRYLARAGRPHMRGETVALIFGLGGVGRGKSEYDPLFGWSMGSDTVTDAFRKAVADDDVRAILFRVDSPGGSYVASDAIWREVVRARDAGKPVVVSMGNVAGSGGYFVAMAADKIVAQPGTVTGSIGVLGGKLLTTGFWNKLGVSFDEVHTSAHASIWSDTRDYSPSEWKRFQEWLDRVYDDFTGKVAQGRGLPLERVREIAKGRIWSGEDAQRLGLVDALGGYEVALKLVREAAGLPPDAPLRLRVYPRPPTPWAGLFGEERESSEPEAVLVRRFVELVRPVARVARELGAVDAPEPLRSEPPPAFP